MEGGRPAQTGRGPCNQHPRVPDRQRCHVLSSALYRAVFPILRRAAASRTVSPAAMCALALRSEEHTSELQSLMRTSYAVFCLKKKTTHTSLTSKCHCTEATDTSERNSLHRTQTTNSIITTH